MPIGIKPYVEDVSLSSEGVGPTVRRSYDPFTFHIDFGGVQEDFFTNPLKVIGEKCNTLGEIRRQQMHDLLDQHIADFMQNKRRV